RGSSATPGLDTKARWAISGIERPFATTTVQGTVRDLTRYNGFSVAEFAGNSQRDDSEFLANSATQHDLIVNLPFYR
ncbi:MAG: hypothetical protein P1V20_31990, partial [Verrucomicrobiales bacterium]|nr:hypothetical protein [Verrucomicrobiales bacterium]